MLYNTPSALLAPSASKLTIRHCFPARENHRCGAGHHRETYAKTKWAPEGVGLLSQSDGGLSDLLAVVLMAA